MIYQKKQIGNISHKPVCQIVSMLFFCDGETIIERKLHDLLVSVVNS